MDPNQIDPQMLAYYKAQFPGQMAMGMGNAPQGTNSSAGMTNGMTKLLLALMQQNAMKKYGQQYPAKVPEGNQGQTLNMPSDPSPQGMGVPGGP